MRTAAGARATDSYYQDRDGAQDERHGAQDLHGAASFASSTPHQTAWAVLALLAAGEARSESTRRGVEYLLRIQPAGGLWSDPAYTAPGFPRVFFLKYHGYCAYFPLWALAAYRTATHDSPTH